MNPRHINKHEYDVPPSDDFAFRLDGIVRKPLTPETIDSYADDALDDLISLTQDIVDQYRHEKPADILPEEPSKIEDQAFENYGLRDIGKTIDTISAIAEEIHGYEEFLAGAVADGHVFVPPDETNQSITNGEGERFRQKSVVQRTKTLLFILAHDFGINIHNQDELKCDVGVTDKTMMRRIGYTVLEIAEIERVVLICDEEGNVTYVFDRSRVSELGLSSDALSNMKKSELNHLIVDNPGAGKRVVYSTHFIGNMVTALRDISENFVDETRDNEHVQDTFDREYLNPDRAIGELTLPQFAKVMDVSLSVLKSIVREIRADSEVHGKFLAENEKAKIVEILEKKGLLNERMPDGWTTHLGLSRELGVDPITLEKAIKQLNEDIGERVTYRAGARVVPCWSPVQQQKIKRYMEENGYKSIPPGYVTINGLARTLGISRNAVSAVLNEVENIEARVTTGLSSGGRVDVLPPDVQEEVKSLLELRGTTADKPPDGVHSAQRLAKIIGVTDKTVYSAVEALGDALGEIRIYKFKTNTTRGYDETQQELIIQYLEGRGMLGERAPEVVVSAYSLAKSLGITEHTLRKCTEALGERLGEVKHYKFLNRYSPGYDLTQRRMIEIHAEQNHLIPENLPEGYMTIKTFVDTLGASTTTVKKAVRYLGPRLGEIKMYRAQIDKGRLARALNKEQQEILEDYLRFRGIVRD